MYSVYTRQPAYLLTPTYPPVGGWSTLSSLREKRVIKNNKPSLPLAVERVVGRLSHDRVSLNERHYR